MYAAPDRLTRHRLVALDVPTPSWMRAPGECPGMFALESAIDELAVASASTRSSCGSATSPPSTPRRASRSAAQPRRLPARGRRALRLGRARPDAGRTRDGRWLVGTGVAASTYPAYRSPSKATARFEADGASRSRSPPPTSAPARAPS